MAGPKDKLLVQRWVHEVQTTGDIAAVDRFLSPDYVDRTPPPRFPSDRDGVEQVFTVLRSAFPDLQVQIHDQSAEGDRVVTRKTFSGTHLGPLFGLPPTGRHARWMVIDILRVEDGRIHEHWSVTNGLDLLRQLGALPPSRL